MPKSDGNAKQGERIASIEATMVAFEKNQQALEHKVDAGFTSVGAKLDALDSKIGIMHADTDSRFMSRTEVTKLVEELIKADEAIKVLATSRLWQATGLTGIIIALLTFFITRYFNQ